jgi:S1-C subfamily serine protease
MALHAALLPSSDGSFVSSEQGSNRVKVDFVLINSPAYNAGLQQGDIITAVDGIPVRGIGDRALRDLDIAPRELFHYTIERQGQEQTLAVRPKVPAWMRDPVVGNESSSPSGPWEHYQSSPAKP